jgi:hypothetical protein
VERKELEVFSDLSNYAIVRMPGRSYPGCVIQGDSLSILLSSVERSHSLALGTGNSELVDQLASLKESLEDRLMHYEQVIKGHGFDLPYFRARGV